MIIVINGTSVIVSYKQRPSLVDRSRVNFTSSAFISDPSWIHAFPEVSFRVVSSAHSYSVARHGCIFISES